MYEEFGKIREWIDAESYDLKLEQLLKNYNKRKNGGVFTKRDHCESLLLSVLSANRPTIGLETRMNDLRRVFHNYDPDFLYTANPDDLIRDVTSIQCGNKRIRAQMQELSYNVGILNFIESKFGDADYAMKIAETLPDRVLWLFSDKDSPLKFKGVAIALAAQYMKALGIDIVKPDIHVRRIIQRFGWTGGMYPSEILTIQICRKVAEQYGITQAEVGTVLWQFCAVGYIRMCGDIPRCSECPASDTCQCAKYKREGE